LFRLTQERWQSACAFDAWGTITDRLAGVLRARDFILQALCTYRRSGAHDLDSGRIFSP
jgi:hypothetical protein